MTHAYDKNYLDKAQIALACMLDCAVYDLSQDISLFFDLFIATGISRAFENGDPSTIVGKSGIELAYDVLNTSKFPFKPHESVPRFERSAEYWTGWALAYYQWNTALSFSAINKLVPIANVCKQYDIYHEMDIRQFCDYMNETIRIAQPETNLKRIRASLGLSQKELATESGIPLRTIQQYEQRQKNINKAQVDYLVTLSSVLHCDITALIERL